VISLIIIIIRLKINSHAKRANMYKTTPSRPSSEFQIEIDKNMVKNSGENAKKVQII
jgi:hypothetical protein